MTAEIICLIFGSSVLAALVTQGGTIALERMRRKAAKAEKHDALMDKLTEIDSKLANHIDADNRNWADNARTQILRFGDELKQGVPHTEEHYNEILNRIKTYEDYCTAHPKYPNSKAICTIEFIKDRYLQRLDQNDFL